MRIRNVKNKEILNKSPYLVKECKNYKGKWSSLFSNNNPIYLEIGSGKGKFIIDMALKYPNINFIALDRFDNIIIKLLNRLEKYNKIPNLLVIKEDASVLGEIFNTHEINTLFLNFSDPWPKLRHEKRRLTYKTYLDIYKNLDIKDIYLKTDNRGLFEYSIISIINSSYKIKEISLDLHADNEEIITTDYEEKFLKLNKQIYYLKASLINI